MKLFYTVIISMFIFCSCKKEKNQFDEKTYLNTIKNELRDSLSNKDYISLDFPRAVFNRVDSVGLYFLRIPFINEEIEHDFVIVKTLENGKVIQGKIVQLTGEIVEVGEAPVKEREWEGRISLSSLNRRNVVNSEVHNGYIDDFHNKVNFRESGYPIYPSDDLPEVVVVAYIRPKLDNDFSTWLWLNSFFYNGNIGGGYGSSYYGSIDGSGGYSYGGGGTRSGGSSSDVGITENFTLLKDIETFVDHDAIDVTQYLKCFNKIPDDGSLCSIEIHTDIPVDDDPNKFFNWKTQSPGHVFLELKKSNGISFVQQSIGFYPKSNWKNVLSADPVDSKLVDDGHHEYNASLKMTVTPFLFNSAINKIKELASNKYDMDEFNCSDFALDVFNYVRTPLKIPQYVIPGGALPSNTPQGLFNKLNEMKQTNDVESRNVSIGFYKAYVGGSSGPCN